MTRIQDRLIEATDELENAKRNHPREYADHRAGKQSQLFCMLERNVEEWTREAKADSEERNWPPKT